MHFNNINRTLLTWDDAIVPIYEYDRHLSNFSYLTYLALLGLASVLRREVGGGDVLVLSGAEVPLPSRPPVIDDPAVVLLDVRHHLALVVDVPRHRHLSNKANFMDLKNSQIAIHLLYDLPLSKQGRVEYIHSP